MKNQIDILCKGGNWLGNTSENFLNSFENVLNVKFPEDYKYFFETYGSGSKNGIEIAGYDSILISDKNIIAKTIIELRDYYYYPKHYLFFSDTGDGGQIGFNKNTWEVLEIYKEMPNKIIENKISNSFFDFLKKQFG